MIWTIVIPMAAILSILVFWTTFRNSPEKFEHLSINGKSYSKTLKRSEIKRTAYSLIIFALVGGMIDFFEFSSWAKTYDSANGRGTIYMIISALLLLGANDIYFYVSHRFMHWEPFFKQVHYMHHQSHTPNPFSAFSFHPFEGLIQIGFLPILVLILPLHEYLLLGFVAFLMLMSVYGHCGYELRPNKSKVFRFFNNSIHHNQHHRYVNYNYGLYLNLWDMLFNTNHPNYEEETERFRDADKKTF